MHREEQRGGGSRSTGPGRLRALGRRCAGALPIWAPGAALWVLLLSLLPNPSGRWSHTTGPHDNRHTPPLQRSVWFGQAVAPPAGELGYLGLAFRPQRGRPTGDVRLRLLSGQGRPAHHGDLRRRTVAWTTVAASDLPHSKLWRWKLPPRARHLTAGAYLMVTLPAPPKGGKQGLWLARPGGQDAPGDHLWHAGQGVIESRPLPAPLLLEAGHRGRVQPFWAALLKRPAALAAALGLALLSFGLVVWLEPRPRQTLRQLRSTLRALRHNPLLRPWADQRQWWPAALAALGVLLVVVLQRAWITDDAFLTLRTVENYIGGHGLTWNPGERVQIFTHPLWALLLVAAVALLGSYAGVMVLSVLSTAAAAAVVVLRLAATPYSALLAAALLVLSNAFVSFSTSGLENPLTHLLLVLFVLLYLHRPRTRGGLLLLLLLAGLALFCRLDTALLYLPALVVALWQHRQELRLGLLSQLRLGAMALAPLFSWLLFSLFYYGSALPNTARAKLATGIPRADLLAQGGVYLADSLARDPVTLAVIGSSALVPLITGQRRLWPLLAGAWLYLAYTVWIGGCFMSGRFLTAPLLLAVVVWARLPLADLRQAAAPTVAFGVLGLLLRPFPYDSPGFRQPESGVVDERLHYQAKWGLVFLHRSKPPPAVGWSNPYEDGKPFTCGQAGVRGYTLGASQHLVDVCALGDPLLARLPAEGALGGSWRIGHYMRILPGGYVQSAVHDQNLLRSPGLFRFYAGLRHVVRGDLFDPARLARIARLPGSRLPDLSHLFRTRRLTPEQLARQGPRDGRPHGGIVLGYSGVLVSLGERRLDPRVEVALGQGCGYLLFFLREGRPLGTVKIHTGGERGMVVKRLGIPRRAQKEGYDSIRVVPFGGAGEHAIFHLRPL